jgi:hypothetical protein
MQTSFDFSDPEQCCQRQGLIASIAFSLVKLSLLTQGGSRDSRVTAPSLQIFKPITFLHRQAAAAAIALNEHMEKSCC